MSARLLRLIAACVGVFVIGVAVALVARGGNEEVATRNDPHGRAELTAAQSRRLLSATQAASTGTPRAELVAEGRALFRSAAVAKDGESCQSCHTEGAANAELGATPHPVFEGDFKGLRDPPSLWAVDRTAPYFWDARITTLRETVVDTIVTHFREGASQSAGKTGEQAAALVAYLSTLRAPRTRFDSGTLPPAAQRGLRLFQTKGACSACHGGPDFTDNALHDTLVPKRTPADTDPGAQAPAGTFNTPQLRDVRNTAPYMHNGALGSLRDVVEFYDQRSSVAPLRLTAAEVDDLVAFLEEL
jgi:cytochrome c peroxidase